MMQTLREGYIDNQHPRDKATPSGASRFNPFTMGATQPTTSVNLASSFSAPPQPFFEDSRPSDSSVYLDLASERQSMRTSHRDLEHELLQSMRSLDLMPKSHAVSNEIPSIFESVVAGGSMAPLPQEKQFFILSSAGKPVYSMHGQDELVMGLMGIVHTVISYFKVHNTKMHSIVNSCGNHVKQKFVFLDKTPIILMAMSSREESVNDLLQQLDFLYSYLICTLSRRQLTRLFSKRDNFDLRHFLTNTDFQNLNHICDSISNGFNPDFLLGALRCLTLRKSTRQTLHSIMLAQVQHPDVAAQRNTILYGLIVAPGGQLCSVLRPRGHTLHTTDLHLLFSLIFNQFQGLQDDQELWLPICFPKFNSSGFLHCYIRLLAHENPQKKSKKTPSPEALEASVDAQHEGAHKLVSSKPALVLISAQKESFFALKKIGQGIVSELHNKNLLEQIEAASTLGFTMADIPAKFVHHFIYKSKKHVQYIMPRLDDLDLYNMSASDDARSTFSANDENASVENDPDPINNGTSDAKVRQKAYLYKLMRYYTHIRNNAMDESGSAFNRSTLTFVQWSNDGMRLNDLPQGEEVDTLCLAWLTPNFELFLICNNGVSDRNTILKSAKNIVDWCRKNEDRLFVKNGAVF
ncbi:LANO_0F02366g1_1 [Lachancea nothofagi CBS 11611]|uniref:Vacuolar fusion protein MON1 n=1 Tax=Lachancea nothofagi CBS 11611 TaxID=1266666 RepID=A0A1G4K6Q4_9SACH|nr:LANO_0F02366g1_1 [Lachancea nothofagi CBS 11611]